MSDADDSRRWRGAVVASLVTALVTAGRAGAQSTATPSGDGGSGGGSDGPVISGAQITDAVVDAIKTFLTELVSPVEGFIEQYGGTVIRVVLDTPTPSRVFAAPTNGPWVAIYDYYWGTVVPVALLLFALAGALVIVLETTSTLFSSYHRAQLKRRAVVALFGVLSWWWINAFALRLVDGLVLTIAPSLADVTLFEAVSFGALGLLGVVVSLATDFVLIGVVALLYVLRHILIYLYALLVPLLVVAWIPGVGPFRFVSGMAKQAASLYVPLLIVPLPVALLFRLSLLLGESASFSSLDGFGAWVAALVVPFVAVLAPVVLVWQTGRITATASMAARNLSRRRAAARARGLRSAGKTVADRGAQGAIGARNFVRGARRAPTTASDGQHRVDASGSRAHAIGSQTRRSLGRMRRRTGADDGADTGQESVEFDGPTGRRARARLRRERRQHEPINFDRSSDAPER